MGDNERYTIRGGYYIDLNSHHLYRYSNDKRERLDHFTKTEFKILSFLIDNQGKFLSHEEIIVNVWGYDTTQESAEGALTTHVRNIRRKLEFYGLEEIIETNEGGAGQYKIVEEDPPSDTWPCRNGINKIQDDKSNSEAVNGKNLENSTASMISGDFYEDDTGIGFDDKGDSESAKDNTISESTPQKTGDLDEDGINICSADEGNSKACNEISGNESESPKKDDSHKEGIDRDAYDKSDSEQADEIPEIKAASLNKGDSSEKENQPGGQDGGDGGGNRPPNYLNIAIIIGFVLTLAIITIYVLIVRENDATENTTLPSATNNESLDSSKDDLINGQISYIMDESGNDRFSYTNNQIESGILGDTITFNSISDGKFGDEKFFVSAKAANDEVEVWNNHTIIVRDGETYTIRMYVHNDNPNSEAAMAENVKARFNLPNTISRTVVVTGYLESSNAIPMNYFDSVILTSDDYFRIEYIDGSASYTNTAMGTIPISDSVKSFGIPLGYKKFDGMIPGGYEFDGFVTIAVTVHKSVPTQTEVKARIKGTKGWNDEIWANVGDEIEFQIEYVNYHDYDVRNVMVRDKLPTNIQYVEETTYLYNINHQDGALLLDEKVTTDGINIGTYGPESNAYVRFTGKVVDVSLVNGTNKLVNWSGITESGRVFKDDVVVWINK